MSASDIVREFGLARHQVYRLAKAHILRAEDVAGPGNRQPVYRFNRQQVAEALAKLKAERLARLG